MPTHPGTTLPCDRLATSMWFAVRGSLRLSIIAPDDFICPLAARLSPSVMHPDFASLLPESKMDTERAEAIVALGYPAVEPVLPALVEWMQDMNWPVAQVFQPFLAQIGAPLAPHLCNVLKADDDIWKYWVVRSVVAESAELARLLRSELQRLASSPTKGEQEEELHLLAQEILESTR